MKYLALIPLVFVASCASRPQLAVRPAPPAAVAPAESLRYAEVVRAYHVGRQVDPNHPDTIAERHPVYRVEVSSRWNLHPGSPNAATLLNPPPDAAFAPPPTNDVVVAEMNRQREATAQVMQQAARLAQSYQELQKVFGEMKTVAQNNALLNARLAAAEQRVTAFEKEMQKLTGPPAAHPGRRSETNRPQSRIEARLPRLPLLGWDFDYFRGLGGGSAADLLGI